MMERSDQDQQTFAGWGMSRRGGCGDHARHDEAKIGFAQTSACGAGLKEIVDLQLSFEAIYRMQRDAASE
jgi:hypothetical protein